MKMVEITGVDTSKLKVLPQEEQLSLLNKIRKGDMKARDEMIFGNLKLILSILKKFNDKKESIDDLFQVGCIGLMKAVDNFDVGYNVKFSTYAVPMIIGEIRRYLRDSSSIRISRTYKDIAYKAIAFKDEYLKKYHHEPKIEEISKHINVDSIDIIMALEAIQDTISMSTTIYDNGTDAIELQDQIADDKDISKEYIQNKILKEAISKLSNRERLIIYNRYFQDKTQSEVAKELDISQAQVSRLEKNALKQMHDYMKN